MSHLEVLATGPHVLVQDAGRPGQAHLGVPRSGALDRPAWELGQRLVGNAAGTAGLEVLVGGLRVRSTSDRWVSVTGAVADVRVDGRAVATGRAVHLPAGAELALGVPARGARSYLAVAGGIAVDPVLGSRSTDTLSGLGPPVVTAGDLLPLGTPAGAPSPVEAPDRGGPAPLRLHPGPRAEWCDGDPVAQLAGRRWRVDDRSDRVGLRLAGEPLRRRSAGELPGELPSEGVVLGAVQLPPNGTPVVFLADHPTTGGYPVVAVVDPRDVWRCAQLRPGEEVDFTRAR